MELKEGGYRKVKTPRRKGGPGLVFPRKMDLVYCVCLVTHACEEEEEEEGGHS